MKKGADLKTGDTVTVQIPAGLIPLRHFTLDTDSDGNKTMDIQEALSAPYLLWCQHQAGGPGKELPTD